MNNNVFIVQLCMSFKEFTFIRLKKKPDFFRLISDYDDVQHDYIQLKARCTLDEGLRFSVIMLATSCLPFYIYFENLPFSVNYSD